MAAEKSYDYLFKVLLLGDSDVGKAKILFHFASFETNDEIKSTIGIDFKIRTIEIQGKKIKLQLWDTAGQERFHTITTSYYRGAVGFVVVYDITQEETFDNVLKWLWNIEEHASEGIKEKMILGNNCHMDNKRVVSRERGEQLAKEHGARFFEVSAEENINIEEALFNLAENMLNKRLSTDDEETSQNIRVSNTEEKKGRCY